MPKQSVTKLLTRTFIERRSPLGEVVLNAEYASLVDAEQLERYFLQLFSRPKQTATPGEQTLRQGRGHTLRWELASGERLFLRAMYRGGLVKHISADRFFRLPFQSNHRTRPVLELKILSRLYDAGIRVPYPVAAYLRFLSGGIFYQGGVITREIPGAKNLLNIFQLERRNELQQKAFRHLCASAGKEARKMVRAGVLHRDLHPGNVVCAENGEVYLVDFDRAVTIKKRDSVRSIYALARRWERAVVKNRLGEEASICFQNALLNISE